MQVLDAMQVSQREGKTLALFGRDQDIDIDSVNRLIAVAIATTVAKGLPASSETRQKNVGHDSHPMYGPEAGACPPAYR
jgi:hypothetical protein